MKIDTPTTPSPRGADHPRHCRRHVRRTWALFTGLLVTACASNAAVSDGTTSDRVRIQAGNQPYDLELSREHAGSSQTIDAVPDEVWAELPHVYEGLGLEGGVVDNGKRVYGSTGYHLAPRRIAEKPLSRYLSCGSGSTGPRADTYEVRIRALTQVTPATGHRTTLVMQVDAVARPRGVSGGQIACASNGRLEALVAQALAVRTSGGR